MPRVLGAASDHAHDHGAHGHGHAHAPADFGRAFLIGIVLNLGFVVIEAVYGWLGNSMALVADAGHNLSDVLGLAAAWIASLLVRRRPSVRFTYGLRGASILAALFNAVFLLVATGIIIAEAVQRLSSPGPVAGSTVMIVAGIGIVINGVTAWLFTSGRDADLNIRGAYLHMVADAAVSVGVVVTGLLILATGWNWIDPLVSLVIAALIVWASWNLLRESVAMSLSAVPAGIDPEQVRGYLSGRPDVVEVHDLHIWAMSTTETALTAHLVLGGNRPGPDFLHATASDLKTRFDIAHATIQIEEAGLPGCSSRECTA